MAHPGSDNLIPLDERTKDEQREIQKKGGIASGKARRKKANIKKTLEALLAMDIPDNKLKSQLETLGIDPSLEQGLVFLTLMRTMKNGTMFDLDLLTKMLQQNITLEDKKEQKARTDKIKATTENIKANKSNQNESRQIIIVDEWQDED